MTSGIYAILNIITEKYYIGSAVDFKYRWQLHKARLNNRDHHNQYLQNAFNKYGKENFIFVVIEYVEDKNILLEREQFWIKELNCCDKNIGYNARLIPNSNLGIKISEETRKRMSASQKGRVFSEEHKKNIKNRKWTDQARLNMSNGARKRHAKIIENFTVVFICNEGHTVETARAKE